MTRELTSLSLVASDLSKEQHKLQARATARRFEIERIKQEVERENQATAQLMALSAKMRAELARLTVGIDISCLFGFVSTHSSVFARVFVSRKSETITSANLKSQKRLTDSFSPAPAVWNIECSLSSPSLLSAVDPSESTIGGESRPNQAVVCIL